jgi:hypothetical protein
MKKYVNPVQAIVSTAIAPSAPAANVPTVRCEQVNIRSQTLALLAILETENAELRNSAVQLALEIQELRMRPNGSVESLVADRDIRSGGFYH